ncbi:MAG TPA: hypothetical protein VHE35_26500 [Kofleriaceae bacterium]|nr:hypothetical protein [Kofleriaceae bacterium]
MRPDLHSNRSMLRRRAADVGGDVEAAVTPRPRPVIAWRYPVGVDGDVDAIDGTTGPDRGSVDLTLVSACAR